MDREQKRKQRVQLRCLKKLDKKEEKLLEERNPSLIAQKAGELTAPVREKLREKVPEKLSDGAQAAAEKSTELLEKAFEKSFEVVLEKGSRWIGKLCSEEKLREDYLQFAQKPLSGWELYKLGCKAAGRAGANMAFSSVQGGLMGALGIGLPDVPIFLGAVFKTLFEISLRFGYPYDTQPEQIYQMLLICAAVGDEAQRRPDCTGDSAEGKDGGRTVHLTRTGEEAGIARLVQCSTGGQVGAGNTGHRSVWWISQWSAAAAGRLNGCGEVSAAPSAGNAIIQIVEPILYFV